MSTRQNYSKSDFLPVPDKNYFTIGEISRLCKVKQHVLRYWEREFGELQPQRRGNGNRRYYRRQDVYLVRQISDLLRRQRYTIDGARRQLSQGSAKSERMYSRQLLHELRKQLEEIQAILKA